MHEPECVLNIYRWCSVYYLILIHTLSKHFDLTGSGYLCIFIFVHAVVVGNYSIFRPPGGVNGYVHCRLGFSYHGLIVNRNYGRQKKKHIHVPIFTNVNSPHLRGSSAIRELFMRLYFLFLDDSNLLHLLKCDSLLRRHGPTCIIPLAAVHAIYFWSFRFRVHIEDARPARGHEDTHNP